MNLLKIIDDLNLDKIDQEEYLKPAMRRGLFKKASDFSLKAALASIPFALVVLPKIAEARIQDDASVASALNLALTLEYLEMEYYYTAVHTSGLIPSSDAAIFNQIYTHEKEHVAFLKSVLKYTDDSHKPTFDFTAGGNFTPFSVYAKFLELSQAFEDTGVRAYKGQAINVMSNKVVLNAALQIHSVEARHASEVRRLRGIKGWITMNDRGGLPSQAQAVYDGEENLTQARINIKGLAGLSDNSLTEAFDEPIDAATATAIASLFIKK